MIVPAIVAMATWKYNTSGSEAWLQLDQYLSKPW